MAGRMARSWGMVGGLLLFFMALGSGLTWGGLFLSHHLTPMNKSIATAGASASGCAARFAVGRRPAWSASKSK